MNVSKHVEGRVDIEHLRTPAWVSLMQALAVIDGLPEKQHGYKMLYECDWPPTAKILNLEHSEVIRAHLTHFLLHSCTLNPSPKSV
jgi:hypothetical protein